MRKFEYTLWLLFLCLFCSRAMGQELGQTDRLAGLCKVWGFLKYYHNDLALGKTDWDRVLLEAIPRVKVASSRDAFEHEMLMLIRQASVNVPKIHDYPETVAIRIADFAWMDDRTLFSPLVRDLLKTIKASYVYTSSWHYEAEWAGGNCRFPHEAYYPDETNPNEGYRLLALFRFWNVIQYFSPNLHIMDENWNDILVRFIPRFLEPSSSATAYNLLVREFTACIDDGHASMLGPVIDRWWGEKIVPIKASWIENQTVVVNTFPSFLGGADVRIGDVVTQINGKPMEQIRQDLRNYVNASNESYMQYNICKRMFRTNETVVTLTLERGGGSLSVSVPTIEMKAWTQADTDSQPREHYRILPGNIGYIHMGALKPEEADAAMLLLMWTRAIVFDVRNYPQGTIYAIANYLFPYKTDFCAFTHPDLNSPGYYGRTVVKSGPENPNPAYYKGRVVALTDASTVSHAEFSVMCLQADSDATVIGSQTAGADGNVSTIALPGIIDVYFTGLGVFYPDGRPAQRIGIVPDIVVQPTLAGIRAGRDEALERALAFIETGK